MSIREDEINELFLDLKEEGENFLAHALSVVMAAESVGAEDQLAKLLDSFIDEISPDDTYPNGVPLSLFTDYS